MPRRQHDRLEKLGQINQLTADTENPLSAISGLSQLYGIQQEDENNPLKQALLQAQIDQSRSQMDENRAHGGYYDELTKQYGSTHQKNKDDLETLSGLFGGSANIPEKLKRQFLIKMGLNPDDAFDAAPAGEMSASTAKPKSTAPSSTSGLTPARGLGEFNWLRNEVGVPAYNTGVDMSNYLRNLLGFSPFEHAQKRLGAINPFTGQ